MALGAFTTSNYLTIPVAAIPFQSDYFMISMWFRANLDVGNAAMQLLHACPNGSSVYNIGIWYSSNLTRLDFVYYPDTGGSVTQTLHCTSVMLGTNNNPTHAHEWWYCMYARYGPDKHYFLAGNPRQGIIDVDGDITNDPGNTAGFDQATIGLFRSNGTKARPWLGEIAYVKFNDWAPDNADLVADMFLQDMANFQNCVEGNASAYPMTNEDDPAEDVSRHGRDGTIVGSLTYTDNPLIVFDPAYGWESARVPASMSLSPKVEADMWLNEETTIGEA